MLDRKQDAAEALDRALRLKHPLDRENGQRTAQAVAGEPQARTGRRGGSQASQIHQAAARAFGMLDGGLEPGPHLVQRAPKPAMHAVDDVGAKVGHPVEQFGGLGAPEGDDDGIGIGREKGLRIGAPAVEELERRQSQVVGLLAYGVRFGVGQFGEPTKPKGILVGVAAGRGVECEVAHNGFPFLERGALSPRAASTPSSRASLEVCGANSMSRVIW